MNDPEKLQSTKPNMYSGNRRHFLVDFNGVFNLFGKRYFMIFYFGRHLHPRQQKKLVNQRKFANWLVLLFVVVFVGGFVLGITQLVYWRLHQDDIKHSGARTTTYIEQTTTS